METSRDGRGPVRWSPDGRYLATASIVWEMPNGEALAKLERYQGNPLGWDAMSWSPQGDLLAAGNGKTLRLWETRGWRLVAEVANADRIRALAWSPDGNHLAAASQVGLVWKIQRGAASSISQNVTELKAHASVIHSVAWSPDSARLATASADATVRIWQTTDWMVAAVLRGHAQDVQAIAFSPDGNRLATGSADRTGKIWSAKNAAILSDLKANTTAQLTARFSPDAKHLVMGGYDSPTRVWEAQSGQVISSLQSEKRIDPLLAEVWKVPAIAGNIVKPIARSSVHELSWSPDGQQLAVLTSNGEGIVEIWDVGSERRLITIKVGQRFVSTIAWSPDGRHLATGGSTTRIGEAATRLWQAQTGRLYSQLDFQREEQKQVQVESLSWSADGRLLARGGANVTAGVFDVSTGQLMGPQIQSVWVAWSPQGNYLAIRDSGPSADLKIWDGVKSEFIKEIASGADTHSLAWSSNNKLVAAANESSVDIFDRESGTRILRLEGHTARVEQVSWSPDGRFIVTAATDASVKIWKGSSGELLATLIVIGEGKDWLITTPDGLFDGSAAAWQLVGWHTDSSNYLNVDPVEIFFREFYYPGLLSSIMSGKQPRAPRSISEADRRQPFVKLSATETGTRTVRVKLEVAEASPNKKYVTGGDARDVRLFRNGSLVKVWRGDVLKGKQSTTLEATIPIVAGENRFTAYAFNRDNIKSSDASLIVKGAESLRRKGVAYILAVGVNEYANREYNLSYAVADAQAFAEEMKRQQAKLAQYERVEIIPLHDKAATKAAILKSFSDLSGKTQPEDAVIIFFAGHGTAQGNRFYLIPHDLGYRGSRTQLDAGGLQNILTHSVSDEELEQAVEGIDAGQLLMVIDACNSGQALEAEEKRRGPMNSKGLAQLAYEKGMYILTAAQSYQAALEAAKLGHGYLTYALVEEGLKTASPDRAPRDGQVLIREWLDFATARVPDMQLEKIEEQRKLGRELGLLIKFVESDTGADRNVQRPRVFYRREAENSPLIVAKP
jgi:WD40 repeat protein